MTEFTIDRLGLKGNGIANGDIFVPFSLPGERFEGEVEDGKLLGAKRLNDSPDRVEPLCQHFGTCGGCALQHASDAYLEDWKVDTIKRALSAQGIEATFLPIDTSPARSRRRATFSGKRTKKTTQVGFMKPDLCGLFCSLT